MTESVEPDRSADTGHPDDDAAAGPPASPSAPASVLPDIVDAVAAAGKILRAYGRAGTADLAESKVRGDDRTRSVVVVGEIKRGKSALVNALIGREVAIEDVETSTTAAVQFVRADDDHPAGTADLLFPTGVHRIGGDELADWVASTGRWVRDTTVDALPIGATVPVESDALEGVAIVDTPGSGGLDPRHATLAVQSAEQAAVLVVVCDASTPITGPEMDFLRLAAASVENVVVVVTKTDKNMRRWRAVVEDDRRLIREHLGRDLPVLGVSSVRAQAVAALPDGPARDRAAEFSGIVALRELIAERLATADLAPEADGLRTALEGLRDVRARIGRELRLAQDGEGALPDLTAELARLEELKDTTQQWEQHLQRDLTLSRQRALAHLDARLAEVKDAWTTRIQSSSIAVLRTAPQTFAARIQADLLAAMASTAEVFLTELERIYDTVFETPEQWGDIRTLAVAAMQSDEPLRTSEVGSRRQGLFDPSMLTMGVIGTSVIGTMIGIGPIAGVVWIGVNLGYKAMRSGKTNLLTWLRETVTTTRTASSRMLESALATTRPEIVIARRGELSSRIASLQQQIAQAKETAKADAQARKATIERLTRNARVTDGRIAAIVDLLAANARAALAAPGDGPRAPGRTPDGAPS